MLALFLAGTTAALSSASSAALSTPALHTAPSQGGNTWLDTQFPRVDFIRHAVVGAQ